MQRFRPSDFVVVYEDPALVATYRAKHGEEEIENHWDVMNNMDAGNSIEHARKLASDVYAETASYVCIEQRTGIDTMVDDAGNLWWTYDEVEWVEDFPQAP